jgi:hypothetical protein
MKIMSTRELCQAFWHSDAMQRETVKVGGIYFHRAYIKRCIAEILAKEMRLGLDDGERLNPLERLVIEIMAESFGVELPTKESVDNPN